jgi:hypothetical protein
MDSFVAPDHPIQELLFFALGDVDDHVRAACEDLVERLAEKMDWVIGPPEFVDAQEDASELSAGDQPVVTVGGVLKLYTAHPPWSLPLPVDRRHFNEVSTLIEELRVVSTQEGIAFELELSGELVGLIQDGEFDKALKEGFLGEWKRHLENT